MDENGNGLNGQTVAQIATLVAKGKVSRKEAEKFVAERAKRSLASKIVEVEAILQA